MYIRNAQGQLIWVPSIQGLTPATQMTPRQAIQNSIRQQIQREEWMRFNAPPPEDNLYFHDQNSYYEGLTVSNNCHNNIHTVSNPTNVANHGNTIYQGQQTHNQIDPPIPRVIHSTPVMTSPIASPHNLNAGSNANAPTFNSHLHQTQYNHTKPAKDDFFPDSEAYINCMNTLFGSSIKSLTQGNRTRKAGFSGCSSLNVSTCDKSEIDGDLEIHLRRPGYGNAFLCNGIRGPGKKFDYSRGRENSHFGSQRSSRSAFSEFSNKEKIYSSSDVESNIIDSKDDLKVGTNQIAQDKSEYEREIHRSVSSDSSCDKGFLPISPPDDKNTTEPCSPEGAVSVCDSYEEQSYLVDTLSVAVANDKIDANLSEVQGRDRGVAKVTEKINDGNKLFVASVAGDQVQHEDDAQTNAKSKDEAEISANQGGPTDLEYSILEKIKNGNKPFGASAAEDLVQYEVNAQTNAKSKDEAEISANQGGPTDLEYSVLEICPEQQIDESRTDENVYESGSEERVHDTDIEQSVHQVSSEVSDYRVRTENVFESGAEERVHDTDIEQSVHQVNSEVSDYRVCTRQRVNKSRSEEKFDENCTEKDENKICIETISTQVSDFVIDAYPSFDEPAESRKIGEVNEDKSNTTCSLTTNSSDGENKQMDANLSPRTKNTIYLMKTAAIGQTEVTSTNTQIEQNISIMSNFESLSVIDQ